MASIMTTSGCLSGGAVPSPRKDYCPEALVSFLYFYVTKYRQEVRATPAGPRV